VISVVIPALGGWGDGLNGLSGVVSGGQSTAGAGDRGRSRL